MVGYLIKYGRPRLFAFHWFAEEIGSASLHFVMPKLLVIYWLTLSVLLHTLPHTLQKHL
jgi:hypothetical protein